MFKNVIDVGVNLKDISRLLKALTKIYYLMSKKTKIYYLISKNCRLAHKSQ